MTLSDEYSQLKQKVLFDFGNSDKHDELLSMLKNLYKDEINSTRRYEQIKTIGQLFYILELRCVLSRNDVTLLKHIARRLPNCEELVEKIEQYEKAHKNEEHNNSYVHTMQHGAGNVSSSVNSPYAEFMSDQKKERIFNTIVEQIGIYWRDLGRNLGIPEGTIDDIEASNETVFNKATKILEHYKPRSDPQRWFYKLCDALEKSRRKDLSKKLQKIITMNL